MESLQAVASTPTENESRHIAEYTKQVEDIKEALRTIASKASQTSPRIFNVDYKHVQISNSIISEMKEVKKLQQGAQGKGFINTSKNNYDLLVKPDITAFPQLEIEFIKQERLWLAESHNSQLTN